MTDQMTNSEKLEPCACGATPKLECLHWNAFRVECVCGNGKSGYVATNKEDAVGFWNQMNTRPTEPAEAQAVALLELRSARDKWNAEQSEEAFQALGQAIDRALAGVGEQPHAPLPGSCRICKQKPCKCPQAYTSQAGEE